MKLLRLLVGPPGSGKSTYARSMIENDGDLGAATVYVNQDSQDKDHIRIFNEAITNNKDIIVDRMGFSKGQRARYLDIAKANGYKTKIIVLHESYETCLKRCVDRKDHPTIKDEETAKKALHFFFTKYERVEDSEADEVIRIWPEGEKPLAVICDLDGTLCDTNWRQHFVRREGKKDWASFFAGIPHDKPNKWCLDIIEKFSKDQFINIVYCSGRGQEYEEQTREWLHRNSAPAGHLFMRQKRDSRKDSIAKEIILDFEILTRFTPYFAIDDRLQVTQMWRKRGITCLQCEDGNF